MSKLPPQDEAPVRSSPTAAPRARPARTTLRLFSGIWTLLLIVLASAVGTAWWWSGTPQSLGTVLALAGRWMPEGQTLATRDVEASLRGGGRIGWLRWESPTLQAEVQDLRISWQLRPLLERRLQIGQLAAREVVLTPLPPATSTPEAPPEPLEQLALPLDVDVEFDLLHLRWAAEPTVDVRGLRGSYRYADDHHQLALTNVEVADGRYQGTLRLQDAAPMALEAALTGRVQAPLPEGTAPLVVRAEAQASGNLATAAARLQVTARLAPEATGDARGSPGTAPATARTSGMRADAQAEIAPWAAMPLVQAHAEFHAIDAARLWPGAPRTLLSGHIDAGLGSSMASSGSATAATTPPALHSSWQARIDARNDDSGPWDAGKLPITRLQAEARQQGTQWQFPEALVHVGSGRLRASGNWSPAPAPWRVEATLDRLQPQLLHSQLDAAPVSGSAQAVQQGNTIRFETTLQAQPDPQLQTQTQSRDATAARAASGTLPLRIDQLQAKGQWAGNTLQLQTLRVAASEALLEGQATVQTATRAGEGRLDLRAPGLQTRLEGRMSAQAGDLRGKVDVRDAAALQRWAQRFPGMGDMLAGATADGALALDARLEGGWQPLLAQMKQPGTPQNGLRLEAALRSERLDLVLPAGFAPAPAAIAVPAANTPSASTPAPAAAANAPAGPAAAGAPAQPRRIRIAGLQAGIQGTPAQARITVDGSAGDGTRSLQLSTRASGGLAAGGTWQLALDSLRAGLTEAARPGAAPWQLQLDAPLRISVQTPPGNAPAPGTPLLRVDATASRATLGGPVPGKVQVQWQATQFTRLAPSAPGQPAGLRLRTQGTLSGLPMAWAEALGVDTGALDDAGIRGDLVFDGAWDIDAAERLRAHAEVTRRSGDIQVLAGGTTLVRRIQTRGTGTPAETRYNNGESPLSTPTPAGVREARLVLDAQDDAVRARLSWDSERAGTVQADLRTSVRQADGAWAWPEDAPLTGALRARLPGIGAWSFLAPPAWRIDGTLQADATLAGSRKLPQWNGTLAADGLALKIPVEGVDLRDGRLRARLEGNRLRLEEFVLHGGPASRARIAGPSGNLSTVRSEAARDGGTLTLRGDMEWGAGTPTESGIRMALGAELRGLRVLVRSDRQISTTGDLQADMAQGQLRLRGKLAIDRGVIILPEDSAPSLGSDVRIRSAAREEQAAQAAASRAKRELKVEERAQSPTARKPPDIAVTVSMGNDFAVQGMGITTRLAGEIEVRANAATRLEPRITGEIRTVAGRYRAYNQELDVESGIVRFNGPATNPSLDILALRPNITQRAGVRVVGTAESPRVQLYSLPQLPDAETLSWVVLGRSAAGGGADAAIMQQAALALLSGLGPKGGGNLASRFGLDEIGFKGPGEGEDVRSSAISVGKRISDKLYVTYEHSLAGALGTFYVFYDLTQRLALRGQAGSRSAVDLIYTLSYD